MSIWKIKNKWIAIGLIYVSFFSLIGFAIYVTQNANCLWALILTPSYRSGEEDEEDV